MNYACLGPTGTFSEEVARRYFADRAGKGGLLFPTNAEVVQAVAEGKTAAGVVPLENSTEGTVNQVIDALLEYRSVCIVDEAIVPIEHHLIGFPSAARENISRLTRILSHPQALAQCRNWINGYVRGVELEEVSSTAKAVELVSKEGNRGIAAIGNRSSAKLHGLDILAESIQDSKDNVTRFVVLSLGDYPRRKGRYKTSITFSTPRDRAGSLVDVLLILKQCGLNMTKVESRPAKKTLGDYIFIVDFVGHQKDAIVSEALLQMEQQSKFFRILGSYPTRKL